MFKHSIMSNGEAIRRMKHNSLLHQRKQKQTSHPATSPPLVTITTTPSRAATPAPLFPASSHNTATLPDSITQGLPSPKQDLHQKITPTYSPPSSPTRTAVGGCIPAATFHTHTQSQHKHFVRTTLVFSKPSFLARLNRGS